MSETRAITVEKVLPYPPERIWRTLTKSELITKWLMPNDFEPVIGYRFTFQTKPMGDWDGIVQCEVLQCDPPALLLGFQSGLWVTAPFRGDLDVDQSRRRHASEAGA